MPDRDDEALDREDQHWDDVARGWTPPRGVDPAIARAIAATHAADDAVPPDPDFVRRLEADLRRAAGSTAARWDIPAIGVVPNGHAPRPSMSSTPAPARGDHRPRRLDGWRLPAAAMLLVAFGVAMGTLIASRDDGRPRRGPAILAPTNPSPTAAPVDADLFQLVLPDDALPAGGALVANLRYDTIPAGVTGRREEPCCDGAFVQHVVIGAITVTVEATVEVLRADGSRETVPAGQPITLAAGDTLVSRSEHAVTTTNAGAGSADVLGWTLIAGPSDSTASRGDQGWEHRASTTTSLVQEMTGGVVVRLRREVLLADETVIVPAFTLTLSLAPDPESHVVKRVTDSILLPVDTQQDGPITYILTMVPQST